MTKVRLLFSSDGAALGERIASNLVQKGYALAFGYQDEGDLDPRPVSASVLIWSPQSASSKMLIDAAESEMRAQRLIPVSVGNINVPGDLTALTPMDLAGWTGSPSDPRWQFVLDEIDLATKRAVVANDDEDLGDEGFDSEAYIDRAPPAFAMPSEFRLVAGAAGLLVFLAVAGLLVSVRSGPSRLATAPTANGTVTIASSESDPASVVQEALTDPEAPNVDAANSGPSNAGPSSADLAMSDMPVISFVEPTGDIVEATPPEGVASDVDNLTSDQLPQDGSQAEEISREAELTTAMESVLTEIASATEMQNGASPEIDASTVEGLDEEVIPEEPLTAEMAQRFASLDEPRPKPVAGALNAAQAEEILNQPPSTDDGASEDDDPIAQLAWQATSEPAPNVANVYLGNYFKECVTCPDMAAIPRGVFMIGSPDGEPSRMPEEGPQGLVAIDHDFALSTKEVTFDDWQACVGEGGCRSYTPPDAGWGRGKRPVINVSYEDAEQYVRWLSNKTGAKYRLPTEAEWEYAARAGGSAPFAFGALSPAKANYHGEFPYNGATGIYRRRTTQVASFEANPFGLYDVHGNVFEWTSDCWRPDHSANPGDGSAVRGGSGGGCAERVVKGGAWSSGGWRLRSAHRQPANEGDRSYEIGFRVARDLP